MMLTNAIGSKARMRNILLKEEFRAFAKSNKISGHCAIDDDDYSTLPGAVGCVQRNGQWVVYSVDERSKHYGETYYPDAKDAFQAMARQFGKTFTPSDQYGPEKISGAITRMRQLKQDFDEAGLDTKALSDDIRFLARLQHKPSQKPSGDTVLSFFGEFRTVSRAARLEPKAFTVQSSPPTMGEKTEVGLRKKKQRARTKS